MLVNRKISFKDSYSLFDFGFDENLNDNADIDWVNKFWVRGLFRFCVFVSLVFVSFNIFEMFVISIYLMYVIFIFDLIVIFLFFVEMFVKMYIRGIVKVSIYEWNLFNSYRIYNIMNRVWLKENGLCVYFNKY